MAATATTEQDYQDRRDDLAGAIERLHQAAGTLRELAAVDVQILVRAIALHRVVGAELGRLLEEHAGHARPEERGTLSWSVELMIDVESAHLARELEELHPTPKGTAS
jgi:hypothetical protein